MDGWRVKAKRTSEEFDVAGVSRTNLRLRCVVYVFLEHLFCLHSDIGSTHGSSTSTE